ncbi:aldehyde dehydrogenase family protein [Staphylococcus aureus]
MILYGLAGAVFSKDIGKAQRVANKLKLGTVSHNDFHPYLHSAMVVTNNQVSVEN